MRPCWTCAPALATAVVHVIASRVTSADLAPTVMGGVMSQHDPSERGWQGPMLAANRMDRTAVGGVSREARGAGRTEPIGHTDEDVRYFATTLYRHYSGR